MVPLPSPAASPALDPAAAQCAAGRGDALALRWLGPGGSVRDYSYAELAQAADRCATLLRRLGLQPGETVAVMAGRHPAAVIAALGIWKAGGVHCPLFADLGPDPLLARLQLGEARILIAQARAWHLAVSPIRPLLPQLRDILLIPDDEAAACPAGAARHDGESVDFAAALAAVTPEAVALPCPPGHAVTLHFTSGTTAPLAGGTAQPKAVLHDRTVIGAMAASARAAFALEPGEMLWCTAEPGWVTHTAYGLAAPLALGAALLLDSAPLTPTRCLSVLEDQPVAVWYTTPTVIRGLIGRGTAPARSFSPRALRLAASVGEPLSLDAVEWGRQALGVAFRDTWWQTETGAIVLAHPPGEEPLPGSMGRPLPGLRVALARRMPAGLEIIDSPEADGELALWSATLPPWRSLGGEGGALPEELEGWHLSGDCVRRDARGYYWFLGREDEVIKSAGRMIGPFEVEAVLMSHPAVAEAAVVGVPDPLLHEGIAAFVAVHPGFEAGHALRRELLAYAREHLGEALAPHAICFDQELPHTPSGKIIRRLLKAGLHGPLPASAVE